MVTLKQFMRDIEAFNRMHDDYGVTDHRLRVYDTSDECERHFETYEEVKQYIHETYFYTRGFLEDEGAIIDNTLILSTNNEDYEEGREHYFGPEYYTLKLGVVEI